MSIFSERLDGANFNKTIYASASGRKLDMGRKMNAFRKELNQLSRRMGKMAKEHVNNNFKIEGFVDDTVQRWPKKRKPDGKKTLVKTGRMKSTVRIINRTRNSVSISTPVAYAGIHNRPVGEYRRYATGLYPGRQFMGHSKVLAEATKKMIVTRLNLAAQA